MATLYIEAGDDLVGAFKQAVANPNTTIIGANGNPISLQRLGSLAFNPNQTQEGIANSVAQQALVTQEVAAKQTAANVGVTTPSADTLANLGVQQVTPAEKAEADRLAAAWDTNSNNARAETAAFDARQKAATNAQAIRDAELLAITNPSGAFDSGEITPAELNRLRELNTQRINAENAKNPQNQGLSIQDTPAELTDAQKAAALAASNTNVTKASADTLAKLGGTGAAKVADTGTVIDATKLNTQGGGSALTTGGTGALTTGGTGALTTGDVNKMSTSPAATSSPSTINTGSIPALTTADLATWGKTLPQGITADQLKTALEGQQTALSSQNTEFLKNWNTSADALKTNILSGVDTKNQAFGTQATQGFMDAFKNFQIPTNQQTGVNLGNYNDNRNAAADQWWSQYVTGRR